MKILGRQVDRGEPHRPYFADLNAMLRRAEVASPALLVDLDHLEDNCRAVLTRVPEGVKPRVVVKSLPSIPLIEKVMSYLNTDGVMVFHWPFLRTVFRQIPNAKILLGKPLPIAGLKRFFEAMPAIDRNRAEGQIQWLLDTEARLLQYLEFAKTSGIRLNISLEIDIGLHRGGFTTRSSLESALALIQDHPEQLKFSGFMGYDPHVAKAPLPWRVAASYGASQRKYAQMIQWGRSAFPALFEGTLTFNGAGSPTYALHCQGTVANDLSLGSALVKPLDFDLPTLKHHRPAAYIATPVLKNLEGPTVPYLEFAKPLWQWWDPNKERAFFIYGGYWKAAPCSPRGLSFNNLYGRSSNQEMVCGSLQVGLEVDDFIFFRPQQSEAVFLEFGEILAVKGCRLVETWAPLSQGQQTGKESAMLPKEHQGADSKKEDTQGKTTRKKTHSRKGQQQELPVRV